MAQKDGEEADALLSAYAVLGASPLASFEEVRHLHRKQVLVFHPDRGGDRARFQALNHAFKLIESAQNAPKPSIVALVRGRTFKRVLAPRTKGFLLGATDPVDGRNYAVCVKSARREGNDLVCHGVDGKVYRVPYAEATVPHGRALRLVGEGESGRQGGDAGDLYLWFP